MPVAARPSAREHKGPQPPMKLLGVRRLALLLVGTLLLCHGAFGGLHLVCDLPQCAGHAEQHAGEHPAGAGGPGEAHENPAGHGTSTGYFAVLVVGLLCVLLGLLPGVPPSGVGPGMPRPILRRVPAVLRPPPTPSPPGLQVFRL